MRLGENADLYPPYKTGLILAGFKDGGISPSISTMSTIFLAVVWLRMMYAEDWSTAKGYQNVQKPEGFVVNQKRFI